MGRFSKWEIIGGIVAILLAVTMIISLIYPPSKNHYNPSHNLHSQHSCKGLGVPVFPTPSNDETQSESKAQADNEQWCAQRSDLAAQWKTADITSTAFWAGALGIWLVGWTLIATRQATKITKDASMREQRAYLAVTEIRTRQARENFPVTIAIAIKNVGMTPAHNVKIGRIFEITGSDGFPPSPKSGSWGSLAPNCCKTAEIDITDPNITRAVVAGQLTLDVKGVVDYEDIFGESQVTLFNASLSNPPNIFNQSFFIGEHGNGMS